MPKMQNLNNINRVRFVDNTNYDSDKANNGGCYGFWTDYNRLENGNWEVSYGTTADFHTVLVVAHLMSTTTMTRKSTLAEILKP